MPKIKRQTTKKRKIRVYFGCALSHAPKEFIRDIEKIKKALRKRVEVFDFLGLEHPSISDAYQYDTNCVRRCDVIIANITYPSLGLGMEMGVALENKKPMITIIDDKTKTTRFLISGYVDPYHFSIRYKTISQAVSFIEKKLQYLFPNA